MCHFYIFLRLQLREAIRARKICVPEEKGLKEEEEGRMEKRWNFLKDIIVLELFIYLKNMDMY